jgi:hypothetical protein
MTPTLPDILIGCLLTLNAPLPPEAAGEYMAARMGLLAMLTALAAQEAERGPAARIWENQAIGDLFAHLSDDYRAQFGDALAAAVQAGDGDFTWSGLDRTNAALRSALIDLHQEAERRDDGDLQRAILKLYQAMAEARRLDLAGATGG